jgi:hypothetical protein
MNKIYLYLSYAGTLPFILCAVCFMKDTQIIPLIGYTEKVLSGYGLVITSFLAGSHWGQHLVLSKKWVIYLPLLSNINAVLLWGCFLILPFKTLLCVFIFSLLILLGIDKKIYEEDIISYKYFKTRCLVSLIVILSLIISITYS